MVDINVRHGTSFLKDNARCSVTGTEPVFLNLGDIRYRLPGDRIHKAMSERNDLVLVECECKIAAPIETFPCVVITESQFHALILDISCLGDKILIPC